MCPICFDVNHEAILHQSLHIKKTKHPDIAYTHDAENHWFKYIGLADMYLYSYIHW